MRHYALLAALLAPGTLHAQALPCGDPVAETYTFRWEGSDDPGAGVTDYALLRGPAPDGGGWPETVELVADTDSEGIYRAVVSGFPSDRAWAVVMIARGPGGVSEHSNVLTIPALISGPCPGGPPSPPKLLDAVRELEKQARDVRRGAERLEEGLSRMRQELEAKP